MFIRAWLRYLSDINWSCLYEGPYSAITTGCSLSLGLGAHADLARYNPCSSELSDNSCCWDGWSFPGCRELGRALEDLPRGSRRSPDGKLPLHEIYSFVFDFEKIPKDRFDVATHVDPTGNKKNTSLTPHGCFYDGVGDFDTALFKMSPREAAQTDPMQRLMLITAYEALESSGYYDNGDQATRPMNGTFYGVAGDDYRNANSSQDIDTNYITGGIRAFGPGRVSYYLGWEGPSMSVDTACSASGVAIHQAITSLRLRECDLALAGGTNLLSCSDLFAGLSRANFVSATGSCKTFDETADGYCRADGFASVVLKRFTDAVQDKDNILGVIRSVETHHAGTAISLTHPEADTQIALFRKVLCGAGLTIDDIDHVELHGTGTQAGDLAESTAVAGMLDGPRPRDRPLTISSVKPNIGHSEAASGVSSLIKGLQMLQHQVIPRHIGIKKRLNPKLPPLEPLNIVIPSTNMPYHALNRDGRRRMLVNNFNATGGITAMLLEEHVTESLQAKDPRGTYPITLSAATPAALDRSQARLLDYLRSHPQTNVSHLSYTLTARRLHHKHRFSCVAESLDDLTRILAAISSESTARTLKSAEQPFPVFVFTGQTSTLPQAKTLFETNGPFREQLLRLDSLCLSMGLPSFLQVISGDDAEYRSVQKQLALIALEISLAILFQTWGITPSAVIGHSLGEYTALCMSKVISIADALWLVGKRGLLLESKCVTNAYSMIVVALAVEDTKLVLRDFPECEVACINAPKQTVVSGADEDIVALAKHLKSKGVRATNVNVPYGFHSKQVEIIRDEYLEILQGIRFQRPAVPFASTLLGKVVTDENVVDAEYLSRQTREAVCFQSALEKLETFVEDGQKPLWVELGPSPACAPMIVSTLQVRPENILAALHPKKPDWATIGEVVSRYYLSNGTVRWDEYHKQHLDALELLQLPSYPFDLKRYWIQYNGDWIIRKDQASQQMGEKAPCGADLGSITLQCLESTIVEKGVRKLTFAAGVERPCVQVDGATKSTPSSILAADMALASALHLCRLYGHPPYLMALSHMRLSRLLSDRRSTAKVVATQQPTDTNVIDVSIVTSNAAEVTEHAQCRVIVGNGEDWVSEARRSAYLYQSRIDLLQLFESHGQSKRLAGTDAYKFVDNEDESHVGIEDVLLNTNSLEAVAHVRTARCEVGYQCNPHWLGALIDVPSVVINASRHIRYECVGWQTLRFLPVEVGRRYAVHTRMQLHEDSGLIKGDVHALDGNGGIVAVIEQLVFRPTAAVKPEYLNISTHPAQGAPNSFLATEVQDHEVSETSNGGISVDMSDSPRSVHEAPARHVAASPRPEPTQNQEKRASKVHFDTVLHVIAAEIGVETETLTDDTILEDLGIDSII